MDMTRNKFETDVFLCYTPYQMLLSHAVAQNIPDGEQQMYVIPAFDTSEASRLCNFMSSFTCFSNIEVLPGKFVYNKKRGSADQRRKILENIEYLYKIINTISLRRVYSSVDSKEIVQAVMKRSPHNIYIEDGAGAYSNSRSGWYSYQHPIINKLMYKLRFGFWWESIDVYGTSSQIDETRVIYPEYRRTELRGKPTAQITREPLFQLGRSEECAKYLREHGTTDEVLSDIDGLLLLNHSNMLDKSPEYKNILEKFAIAVKNSALNFAVKFHSRDTNIGRFPKPIVEDFVTIPSTIPAELLYVWRPEFLDYVIGHQSTALYTAQWLCSNVVEIISTGQLVKNSDERLLSFFNDIGIRVVQSEEELISFPP